MAKHLTYVLNYTYICVLFNTNLKPTKMEANFNTIEKIRHNSEITHKSKAYLDACDSFELQASKYANNENFIARKAAEEVSIAYAKARSGNCEYAVYAACFAAEKWLEKAYNMAD